MRALEVLRQRITPSKSVTREYAPLGMFEGDSSSDGDEDNFEFSSSIPRVQGRVNRNEERYLRRPRRWNAGSQYTPVYSNMKIAHRKRLDAAFSNRRAGLCTKSCFLLSLWGVTFLTWVGFNLAAGAPYIMVEKPADEKVRLSHSVFGAAAVYLVCLCLSGFSWYRSIFGEKPLPTAGAIDPLQ